MRSGLRYHSRNDTRAKMCQQKGKVMSFIKLLLASLLFGVLNISKAYAGILIEPYLGYGTGSLSVDQSGSSFLDADIAGTAVGARLGYSMLIPFFALDYMTTNETAKISGYDDEDVVQTQVAAVVGASIPLVRVYAGYILSNELDLKFTNGAAIYSGTGTKVGASFKGFPFISINLEYHMNTFNKIEVSGVTFDTDQLSQEVDYSKTFLTVSVPFNL